MFCFRMTNRPSPSHYEVCSKNYIYSFVYIIVIAIKIVPMRLRTYSNRRNSSQTRFLGYVYQHNNIDFDNWTLQTRAIVILKFPLFFEHTLYLNNV